MSEHCISLSCTILSCHSYITVSNGKFLQVITGYLLAGSIIGPGGFNFVSEMVQVCSIDVHSSASSPKTFLNNSFFALVLYFNILMRQALNA
jgi:hypothetical protein